MAAAIVQGAVIVGLTIYLVLGQISIIKPEVSRVIAGGEAGTWFTFGYLTYIIVGVIAVAVSSLFYHYLEEKRRSSSSSTSGGGGSNDFGRSFSALAWTHLILMNVGITAAASMLMLAGYQGGAAMLPQDSGGQGLSAGQAHEIIGPYVVPIGASILVLMVSVIAGGLGFLLVFRLQSRFVKSGARDSESGSA
jgi:hypothetical protein